MKPQLRIFEITVVCATFLFGIWSFCLAILGYHLEYIPGDLGDSRFINYLLEHGYLWITGNADSFWTAHFMHPFQNSIALSDSMIGAQLFYLPWRALGFSVETSYQLWWLVICTLNYWVSYWSFNKVFNNKLLAALLAWVFAFTVYNLGQLSYMQMIIRFPVALAFYSAFRFTTNFSLKYLIIFSLSVVYQFYCVPYTGFYLFYFSIAFIFIYLFLNRRVKNIFIIYFNKNTALKTISILFISGVLMAVLLLPYASMSKTVGLRLYKEVVPNLPGLQSYIMAPIASLPWHFLADIVPVKSEIWWLHYVFPGMLLLLTLIGSMLFLIYKSLSKKHIDLLLKAIIITSSVICLLHLRIGEHFTLYGLIFKLPGINSIRVPNRFMQVELFLLLMIFGYFLKNFNFKIMLIFMVLIFADNSFDATKVLRTPKENIVKRKKELTQKIVQNHNYKEKILAVIDTTQPAFQTHLDAMLVAQELGIPTVNGYSSYCPEAFCVFYSDCSEKGLKQWIENHQLSLDNMLIIERFNAEQL